jgi:hypothetical protein
MKRSVVLWVMISFFAVCAAANADYSVADAGKWPTSWPRELESLRKQARTSVEGFAQTRHYQIPFTNREEFEAAWPYLLKVKNKGAPIILVRGPKTDFFAVKPAGVLIHTPPVREGKQVDARGPLPGQRDPRETWMKTAFIELVVDGNVVDLNRIELPADTPIIDERFKAAGGAAHKVAVPKSDEPVKASGTAPAAEVR